MTDEEIWEHFTNGEDSAFEEVYRRYHPVLSAYGMRMTGDADIVADTIQNLFVKLMRNCSRLPSVSNLKCYLISSFRNALYDEFAKLRPTVDIEEADFFMPASDLEADDKDDAALRREACLLKALQHLSKRQKEVLYLYYVKGLSHKEIAAILSINGQSSKNLLSRTVAIIRNRMFSLYTLVYFGIMMSFQNILRGT